MTGQASIIGAGIAVPDNIIANADLPASLGIAADKIEKKTGIRERRWAPEGIYASTLGAQACEQVFAQTGIDPGEVDCIIAATQSPDHNIPGIGVLIQRALGLDEIPCFDLRNQCSSFLYALQVASAFVETARYSTVLVVCAEVQSHALGFRPEDAHISPLFGDGAGAVLVTSRANQGRLTIEHVRVGARGKGCENLRHRFWDFSQIPPDDLSRLEDDRGAIYYPEMQGEFVFRAAVKRMVSECRACLDSQGVDIDDIRLFLAHQANRSINTTVAALLGITPDRIFSNIERLGNLSSASLPVLMGEAIQQNRLPREGYVLCTVFGAGFTWGAALLRVAA